MTKHLGFGALRTTLTETFDHLPDFRTGKNTQYTVGDAALGAFSVFFMQCPSFLAYQRDMQRNKGCNNAQSLFGVEHIPSDGQIRNLLDPIAPTYLQEPFWDILEQTMADPKIASAFEVNGEWLCSLDGTQYFGSSTVHCEQCTVTHHDNRVSYRHTVLIPVLAKPGCSEVLVLEPEFITPQDGAEKQDCESNAAHRWITRNAKHFVGRSVTILADDLHCKQPFCELLLDHHLDFILTCKPDSHTTLYEEVALLDQCGGVTHSEKRLWTGQRHQVWHYRFVEHVPLRAGPQALYVNWCELTITDEGTGKQLYHNAFATNRPITTQTVHDIVTAGRARWKVENEGNNILKNHGYHLEHNYGHGQQHLATVLATLILLAFLCHTVLQLRDRFYQRLRAELGTRQTFFDDLRALTRYFFFKSWEDLIAFMIAGLELSPE
jgi:hypothetical protein